MTQRANTKATWSRAALVLTDDEVVEKGHLACIDTSTGLVVKGKASTTLYPIGWFGEDKTGDGVSEVKIDLFREMILHWFDNETGSPVASDDIGSECYIKDSEAVSMDGTGRSKAGRVWAVSTTRGVLVELGPAVTGPTGGASGFNATRATRAAVKAITAANRFDGQLVTVLTDGSQWRFVAASSLVADDTAQELVLAPDAGTGAWLRNDKTFVMKIPVAFGQADNGTIETIPDGFGVRLIGLPYWEITTGFTGGTNSALGVNSTKTGFTADGALLGGTGGDIAATLVAGIVAGTIGGALDSLAEIQAALFEEGDAFRVNEITDAFTAGAGFVCMPVAVAVAPATP